MSYRSPATPPRVLPDIMIWNISGARPLSATSGARQTEVASGYQQTISHNTNTSYCRSLITCEYDFSPLLFKPCNFRHLSSASYKADTMASPCLMALLYLMNVSDKHVYLVFLFWITHTDIA